MIMQRKLLAFITEGKLSIDDKKAFAVHLNRFRQGEPVKKIKNAGF